MCRLAREDAPRVKSLIFLPSSTDRQGRSSRLLSCRRSVEFPPLPCLTLKHAKACDKMRNMPKQLITASVQTISIQTDYRPMDWTLSATLPHDQANAMLLQTDRGSACRPMRCPRAVPSQETMRSTSRARDRRSSTRVRSGHHLDQASRCGTRYRWNRNCRPAACRSSARRPSRRSP